MKRATGSVDQARRTTRDNRRKEGKGMTLTHLLERRVKTSQR